MSLGLGLLALGHYKEFQIIHPNLSILYCGSGFIGFVLRLCTVSALSTGRRHRTSESWEEETYLKKQDAEGPSSEARPTLTISWFLFKYVFLTKQLQNRDLGMRIGAFGS